MLFQSVWRFACAPRIHGLWTQASANADPGHAFLGPIKRKSGEEVDSRLPEQELVSASSVTCFPSHVLTSSTS